MVPVENSPKRGLQSVRHILQQTLFPDGVPQATTTLTTPPQPPIEVWTGPSGRYDFDLAEFRVLSLRQEPRPPSEGTDHLQRQHHRQRRRTGYPRMESLSQRRIWFRWANHTTRLVRP